MAIALSFLPVCRERRAPQGGFDPCAVAGGPFGVRDRNVGGGERDLNGPGNVARNRERLREGAKLGPDDTVDEGCEGICGRGCDGK